MKTHLLQKPAAPPPPRRMKIGSVTVGIAAKEPQRTLIYGVGGIGKSTFIAEAPKAIIVDTQDGTKRLDVARFPRPTSWQDILDAIDELTNEDHGYQTLGIDLLDDVESLIWAHICKRDDNLPNIEAYGYGKGFKVALVEWRFFISKLERLRLQKGVGVMFAAHSAVKPFKNPEGEDYDKYALTLNDQAAGLIRGWCDTVLFARHETILKTDKRKRTRGTSTGARLIQTVETAAYYAKNRDNLPDTLPLDYAAFAQAVADGVPASCEAIRSEIAGLSEGLGEEKRAAIEENIKKSGEDATRLIRILNRVREIQIQQQSEQTQGESNGQ